MKGDGHGSCYVNESKKLRQIIVPKVASNSMFRSVMVGQEDTNKMVKDCEGVVLKVVELDNDPTGKDYTLYTCVREPYSRTLSSLTESWKRREIERKTECRYIFDKGLEYYVTEVLNILEREGTGPCPVIHLDSQNWLMTRDDNKTLFDFDKIFLFETLSKDFLEYFNKPLVHFSGTVSNRNVKNEIESIIEKLGLRTKIESIFQNDYELYDNILADIK
jgi:hypothetical protein